MPHAVVLDSFIPTIDQIATPGTLRCTILKSRGGDREQARPIYCNTKIAKVFLVLFFQKKNYFLALPHLPTRPASQAWRHLRPAAIGRASI
jgi:hypothetical protein